MNELVNEDITANPYNERPGLNIGPGRQWRHPLFVNLDTVRSNIGKVRKILVDVNHDLMDDRPFPLESDTFEMIYCSHVIEHLPNKQADHLIREGIRVLKPGGTFRITCPDFAKYWKAYVNNDMAFFQKRWDKRFKGMTIDLQFLAMFAGPKSKFSRVSLGKNYAEELAPHQVPSSWVRKKFPKKRKMKVDVAFAIAEMICESIADFNRVHTSPHLTPWNEKKLEAYGFKHSEWAKSNVEVFRDIKYFDGTVPFASLYMEYVK